MYRHEISSVMHRNLLLRQLLADTKMLILKIKCVARNSAGGDIFWRKKIQVLKMSLSERKGLFTLQKIQSFFSC